MPTGYTEIIEKSDDTTFREYALRCARAFGACVMQRDDSISAPPKHRTVDPYYSDSLKEARAELERLRMATDEQKLAVFEKARASAIECNARYAEERAMLNRRYARMRESVVAWKPPTPEHEHIKTFMLEQIDMCYSPKEAPYSVTVAASAEDHHAEAIESAEARVKYYTENAEAEAQRVRESNAWLDALMESL